MSQEVIEMIERKIREYESELDNVTARLNRARGEVDSGEAQGERIRTKIEELKATMVKLGVEEEES